MGLKGGEVKERGVLVVGGKVGVWWWGCVCSNRCIGED